MFSQLKKLGSFLILSTDYETVYETLLVMPHFVHKQYFNQVKGL